MSAGSNGDLFDTLFQQGTQASVSVGTTSVELVAGASLSEGRQLLIFQPQDNNIYMGFSSAVTTSTGIKLFKDQIVEIAVGDGASVWVIASGAGKSVRVMEGG